MAVQFILGRSGTGKTGYCIRSIVEALHAPGEEPLILLVPEQATYQAERAILSGEGISGYSRLHVLSFDRLQFMLLSKNTVRSSISRIGRQMIIHRILLENKDKLKIFNPSRLSPGLSEQMANTIAELHEYAKTPEDIEKLLSELQKDDTNRQTVLKFADIGLILKQYLKFIENDYFDPDVQITAVCKAVANSRIVRGAKLWIDGFAGFTEAEICVLVELLRNVSEATIAICLDPADINPHKPDIDKIDPANLFYPTEQTYFSLYKIIEKCGLKIAKAIILEKPLRFESSGELGYIERNIFKINTKKITAGGNIRIISAPNERAEANFAAKEICRLVREKKYRYRDIAVIASDIEQYQHYIRACFEDFGIPFFIDKRRSLNQHAVVRLINSAFETVTGNFSHGSIFSYLKSGLVPLEQNDIDLLENYCIAYGISSSDWQSRRQWNFADVKDQTVEQRHINKTRQKVIKPLFRLRDELGIGSDSSEEIDAGRFTRAIFGFLDELDVNITLANWIEHARLNNDNVSMEEHQQVYSKLVDIFDELAEVFGQRKMTAQDFYEIIKSIFSKITLAFIPPRLDQVLVGNIERSRHPGLKAVFLIGASQRNFPVPTVTDGILSDTDRLRAERADFYLAGTSDKTLAERQYLTYIAFTRPSELLYISYPSVDEKGGEIPRSQFVPELESLFENLSAETIAAKQIDIEKLCSRFELEDLLCERLGKDSLVNSGENLDKLKSLLEQICIDEQLCGSGSNIKTAIEYDNMSYLEKAVAQNLFEGKIQSSATRLGTFAKCPYQYFARYILELKERKEFKLEPLDLGDFYHNVLDSLIKRLNSEQKDIAVIEKEQLLEILNQQIEKTIAEHAFLYNFIERRGFNEFIIKSASGVLENCVLAIAQIVRAGSFRPVMSEAVFGPVKEDGGDTIGDFKLVLSNDRMLSLAGKIDRLDFAAIDNQKIGVIFDYKRSRTFFSWSKFFHGIDLQLPVYMLAAQQIKPAGLTNIAGAFYIPVEVPTEKSSFKDIVVKAERFDYRAKGIFNGQYFSRLDNETESGWSRFYSFRVTKKDGPYSNYNSSSALRPGDFEKALKLAKQKIIHLAEEIVSGKIDIRPYRLGGQSPCGYCKYGSVCRFDWQVNDYNFLEPVRKSDIVGKAGDNA